MASVLRVFIVANFLPDKQFSMDRYANLLRQALSEADVHVEFIRPVPRLSSLTPSPSALSKALVYLDKLILFAVELLWIALRFRLQGPGIIHLIDQGNGVYLPLIRHFRHALTCHDLIVIKAGSADTRLLSFYQRWNWWSLKQASWVACVSHATRNDTLLLLGTEPDRCAVIPNPLPPFFSETVTTSALNLPGVFLLHVGSGSFYKNRTGLLQIYHELRRLGCKLPLLLFGEPLRQDEKRLANDLAILDHLQVTPFPSDSDIRSAYHQASALIFPSLDEGFGWPVLEAQAQGCPVFASSRGPLPEVGGSAALYFDPADPVAAASLIYQTLSDPSAIQNLRTSGRENAVKFSMTRFAAEWKAFYQRIMDSSK
jgi:glycosyltransferase involved in cell wall biosynthesis